MGRVADANMGAGASQYYTSHRWKPRVVYLKIAVRTPGVERRGREILASYYLRGVFQQVCLGFRI